MNSAADLSDPLGRPIFQSREELVNLLEHHQADSALRNDLSLLAGETTDDLGPLR